DTTHRPGDIRTASAWPPTVKNHGQEKQIVTNKQNVNITAIEPVGRYGVRLIFDDGHSTGFYSWVYLDDLGKHYKKRWERYQDALKHKNE
ncbi:MAG: gamma-butyrobetaine hydroxylase-like domain-containing protein, partial [Pseudomonadota bacterium]